MKDIGKIEQFFSDDALIITGKVSRADATMEIIPHDRVSYMRQTKSEYIERLSAIFNRNERIEVHFTEMSIKQHPNPAYSQYYGVQVKQEWQSSSYSDTGYVFMLWDFTDENNPIIHVRTWEPSNVMSPFSIDDVEGLEEE